MGKTEKKDGVQGKKMGDYLPMSEKISIFARILGLREAFAKPQMTKTSKNIKLHIDYEHFVQVAERLPEVRPHP